MPRYLVLDWDHQKLHVVAATIKNGQVRLQRAAVWDTPQSPNPAEAESLGKLLRDRLGSAGIPAAPVIVCLGRERVIFKDIRHPPVPAAEEPAIVRFQAMKELNDSPDEVVLDYVSRGNGGGERRALAVIIRRELLAIYETLCRSAGLKLGGVCPRPFGAAWLAQNAAARETVSILTAAQRWAEFCVVRGENLLLARTVAPPGEADDAILGEIRRNLVVYAGQSPQEPVRTLYVADGTPAGDLRDRLADKLAIPVHPLDPLAGLVEPAERRGAFAGAVGLLHALARNGALPINFAKPRDTRPAGDPNRRKMALVAALVAVVLLSGIGIGLSQIIAKDRQLQELVQTKAQLDQELALLKDDEKRIKLIGDWAGSEVVWLDELYDLADRVPDINAMRVTAITADPLTRTSGSKHVARMSIKGICTDNYEAVDNFIRQFVRDAAYRVDPKKMSRNFSGPDRTKFGQQFSTQVDIEPRPPDRYVRHLPPPAAEPPRRLFGGARP